MAEVIWHDARAGIGDEWDFERYGPLTGEYLGWTSQVVERLDRETGELVRIEQPVYQFTIPGDEDLGIVFVWGSYQLAQAFDTEANPPIRPGDLVRISFLGKREIKGGKQQLRRYRVQVGERTADGLPATGADAPKSPEPLPGERLARVRR